MAAMQSIPPDSNRSISLRDQVALVTGGGRGIGRAIAQTLAAAGARVAVVARTQAELDETVKLIRDAGGSAIACRADVTDPKAVAESVGSIKKAFGPVDILVNNAAAVKPFGPIWQTDLNEWWRTMDVNLRGPLQCATAVLPEMVARRRGRIINIVSGAGAMSMPYYSSYITSKTALIRATECLALETKPHGVTWFSLVPGTVRTAMAEYSLSSPEGRKWLPWFRRIFDENINVTADRPAQLALELASGRADVLSGRVISIHDDLDEVLKQTPIIEQQNLYSLKLDRLPSQGSPVLGSIFADAIKTPEKVSG